MVAVKRIEFQQVEGFRADCRLRTFFNFADVDAFVKIAARRAPNDGSYYKCDVCVTWADDTKWYFRFDMTRDHSGMSAPLSNDFQLNVTWHTGVLAVPDGATEAQAALAMRNFDEMYPGARERAAKLLDVNRGYDMGAVS